MTRSQSIVTAVIWVALLLSVTVWLLRVSSAVTFDRPFLANTSGCEEEALFSVWKSAKGYEVYNSPWLPPFSASYFGWLFYEIYGWWAKAGLAVGGLEDAWLPTLTRLFTLLGLLGCIGIYDRLLQVGANQGGHLPRVLLLGLSALVFINPLFHWWSFTTRADVWALVWELAALLAAFQYAQSGRMRTVVLVGLFAFLAWSFRQTNISVLAGFGLWLLFDGRWKVLLVMVASMAVAFAATMVMLGANFIDSAFTANALSGEMLVSVAARNAIGALTKDPLLAVASAFAFLLGGFASKWWRDDICRLLFLTAGVSVLLAATFAAKVGASSNYFLPPAALVPLLVMVVLGRGSFALRWTTVFLGLGAAGVGMVSALVLFGVSGSLRVPGDEVLHELRASRASWPEPFFSTDRVANLPWILGAGPDSYVFGFAYQRMLEAKPKEFKAGTIADQLKSGRFGSVLIADSNASYVPAQEELAHYTVETQISAGRLLTQP